MKQPIDLDTFASTRREIERVFALQRKNRWKMAQTSARERIARLTKLREAILTHEEEIKLAVHADFRKHPAETDLTEVSITLAEIGHTIKHLARWMKPRKVKTPLILAGSSSQVRREARGVVLILAPWNYPFQLLISPLVAALAAGNCVILKPSEKTPHTSRALGELIKATFDPSEVALFEGDARVAEWLLEQPFDHIFFTGSTLIGHKVMAAAAKHLATVTLELGGKSPVIVDKDVDLDLAAERITWGKFVNAGQTCVAPDYLLVHESRVADFLEKAKEQISRLYGPSEEARQQSVDFCRLVDDRAFQRVRSLTEQTVQKGAKVEIGGRFDAATRYIAPTLLSGLPKDAPIMAEEIFGPVLPVLTWKTRDEVYEHINASGKPLALYIFSRDPQMIEDVLHHTSAGGTVINNVMIHLANPNLPFGGVGESGMGNYHGLHGFQAFSHERAVLHQGPGAMLKLLYPPYDQPRKQFAAKMARKINS